MGNLIGKEVSVEFHSKDTPGPIQGTVLQDEGILILKTGDLSGYSIAWSEVKAVTEVKAEEPGQPPDEPGPSPEETSEERPRPSGRPKRRE